MRRSELRRRTPLRNRTEMRRGGPLNPVSARRLRDNRQRRITVDGLRAAQEGRCAHCRRAGLEIHGHELRARAHGGSIINPEVAVCNDCNSGFEDNPRVACWNGWKLSPKWPHDPALEIGTARDLFGNVVVFAELGEAS